MRAVQHFEVWDLHNPKQLFAHSANAGSVRVLHELGLLCMAGDTEVSAYNFHTGLLRPLPLTDYPYDLLALDRRSLYAILKGKVVFVDMDTGKATTMDAPGRFCPPRLLITDRSTTVLDLVTGWRTTVADAISDCCLHSDHLFYVTNCTSDRKITVFTVCAVSLSDPKRVRTLLTLEKPMRMLYYRVKFLEPRPYSGHEPILLFDDDIYALSL